MAVAGRGLPAHADPEAQNGGHPGGSAATLQRRWRSGSLSQGALGDLIARITGRNIGALAPDAKLEGDLNLNSMDRVELMSALEDRYQVDLKEANFAQRQHRR